MRTKQIEVRTLMLAEVDSHLGVGVVDLFHRTDHIGQHRVVGGHARAARPLRR